jgi:putative peptide zinc metalloprotease protein
MAGTLVMPRQEDMPGAFAKRGSILGYVLDRGDIGVRAAVPEYDAALVRERTRGVEVRMAEDSRERVTAQLVREVPAATNQLPSAALGDRGGGPYVTDPADKDAMRTLEPVVLIDLKLPEKTLQRVGGRAWVRFDHGAEPLAGQWYRRLRQLFLQHFDPTG